MQSFFQIAFLAIYALNVLTVALIFYSHWKATWKNPFVYLLILSAPVSICGVLFFIILQERRVKSAPYEAEEIKG